MESSLCFFFFFGGEDKRWEDVRKGRLLSGLGSHKGDEHELVFGCEDDGWTGGGTVASAHKVAELEEGDGVSHRDVCVNTKHFFVSVLLDNHTHIQDRPSEEQRVLLGQGEKGGEKEKRPRHKGNEERKETK